MKNTNEITPLVITDGLDIFQAHDLIDTLSGYKGTEAAIYAIENWAEENAPVFAIRYANEGNADDAAALLEIYDGDGQDDDNWVDVIGAIDKARNAEWLNRSWLEIKSRTIPVTGRDDLRRIERAAAIAGATVSDYGVDDDDNPTDATILAPADKIEILNQLEKHFTAPAEEEPEDEREAYTLPADDARAEEIEQIILRAGLDVSLICNTNAGGYTHTVTLLGDADDIETLLEEITEEEPSADDDADDDAPENNTDAYDAVWHYLGRPDGELLKEILAEISLDVKQDSTNLFKAGQFEGTARMLAAAIVNDGADGGEGVAAITRAVYDYCGIGW